VEFAVYDEMFRRIGAIFSQILVAERNRNESATHAEICRTGQKSPQAGNSFV
jgi:hypothetical protein